MQPHKGICSEWVKEQVFEVNPAAVQRAAELRVGFQIQHKWAQDEFHSSIAQALVLPVHAGDQLILYERFTVIKCISGLFIFIHSFIWFYFSYKSGIVNLSTVIWLSQKSALQYCWNGYCGTSVALCVLVGIHTTLKVFDSDPVFHHHLNVEM